MIIESQKLTDSNLSQSLRLHSLTISPRLVTEYGVLCFWHAILKIFPNTQHKCCWIHKMADVFFTLSNAGSQKVKVTCGVILAERILISIINPLIFCWEGFQRIL